MCVGKVNKFRELPIYEKLKNGTKIQYSRNGSETDYVSMVSMKNSTIFLKGIFFLSLIYQNMNKPKVIIWPIPMPMLGIQVDLYIYAKVIVFTLFLNK